MSCDADPAGSSWSDLRLNGEQEHGLQEVAGLIEGVAGAGRPLPQLGGLRCLSSAAGVPPARLPTPRSPCLRKARQRRCLLVPRLDFAFRLDRRAIPPE